MITAKKLSEVEEKWGIDIVINFTEPLRNINVTKTFSFVNQNQIDSEYETRIAKAITNIEYRILENELLNDT